MRYSTSGLAFATADSHSAGVSRTTSSGSLPSGSVTTRTSSSFTPESPCCELADEPGDRGHADGSCLLPGRIDVVGQRDARGVAREEGDLAGRERRPQRGDDVVEAGLVRHQGVRVALDDDRLAGLADRRLGAIDQVEGAALVEERRRRRVEVLGPLALQAGARRGRRRCRSGRGSGTGRGRGTCRRRPDRFWRGDARPTSTSSSGRMSRLAASWRVIVSQPPGAQPSWCVGDRLVREAAAVQVVQGGLARLRSRSGPRDRRRWRCP